MAAGFVFLYFFIVPLCWYAVSERQVLLFFAGGLEIIAGLREARVGQSPHTHRLWSTSFPLVVT